jgi:hypothetical protein
LLWIKIKAGSTEVDDIYKYLEPLPRWLCQEACVFIAAAIWDRLDPAQKDVFGNRPTTAWDHRRGLIPVFGFHRPDRLRAFRSVTIMSALFEHTMTYAVWSKLGVAFVRSQTITVDQQVTDLGTRKLRIYTLFAEGWSKRVRDRSGGIATVFKLIAERQLIDPGQPVCIVLNVDDDTPENQDKLRSAFPRYVPMPNNVRGQNEYRDHHQIAHLSALNSYTADINFIELVFDIGSPEQRIARTGLEVYQALMRTSLREPDGTHDVTLVVMDHDVALWLSQWFEPAEQVEIIAVDTGDELKRRGRPGRPRLANPKSGAERTREYRERKQRRAAD